VVAEEALAWAAGELLAFGAVLMDHDAVRLVGQDTRRGTCGQRHAVLVDRNTGAEYTPLRQFNSDSAKFHAYDSLLSEFAAVGFEYGYSVARPDALVCWEAQFGDFANGAQTIMDEFISSGEQKWGQHSSVVLLLPHGYEGQGPDHSSARVERLYPVPADELAAQLARYPAATAIEWVQEEPANMGAWPTMALAIPGIAGPRTVRPISLPSSSAPAAGSAAMHSAEHRGVVQAALSQDGSRT